MRVMRPAVLILLTMMASGCGDDTESPTQPTNIPAVAGSWSGTFHVKTCSEPLLLPAGAQTCPALTSTTGATQRVRMTLAQNEAALTGSITFDALFGPVAPAVAATSEVTLPLAGTVDRGGTVLLQAAVTTPVTPCPTTTFRTTVTNLNTTLNRDRDQMLLGTFQLTTRRLISVTGCSSSDVTVDADQFTVALPIILR